MTSSKHDSDCEGYLYIDDGTGGSKKRWCVLQRCFIFYTNKQKLIYTPRGVIDLQDAILTPVDALSPINHANDSDGPNNSKDSKHTATAVTVQPYTFMIFHPHRRTYHIRCENASELEKWMQAISESINHLKLLQPAMDPVSDAESPEGEEQEPESELAESEPVSEAEPISEPPSRVHSPSPTLPTQPSAEQLAEQSKQQSALKQQIEQINSDVKQLVDHVKKLKEQKKILTAELHYVHDDVNKLENEHETVQQQLSKLMEHYHASLASQQQLTQHTARLQQLITECDPNHLEQQLYAQSQRNSAAASSTTTLPPSHSTPVIQSEEYFSASALPTSASALNESATASAIEQLTNCSDQQLAQLRRHIQQQLQHIHTQQEDDESAVDDTLAHNPFTAQLTNTLSTLPPLSPTASTTDDLTDVQTLLADILNSEILLRTQINVYTGRIHELTQHKVSRSTVGT